MNAVILIGRIANDLTLQKTPNGKGYVSFRLAVDNPTDTVQPTTFVPCTVWNKQADSLVNFQRKGSLISVEGKLSIREYEKDGQKRTFTEVIGHRTAFLEKKSASEGRTQAQPQAQHQPQARQQAPARQQAQPAVRSAQPSAATKRIMGDDQSFPWER